MEDTRKLDRKALMMMDRTERLSIRQGAIDNIRDLERFIGYTNDKDEKMILRGEVRGYRALIARIENC